MLSFRKFRSLRYFSALVFTVFLSSWAWAHHGASSTSLGAGSPVETNSPLTLPAERTLIFFRNEYVPFKRFSSDPETVSFNFTQLGLAYGINDWLTAGLIVPYNIKTQDPFGSYQGIGDLKFFANMGFNYAPGEGLNLNGPEDTAVSLGETNKTFFSIFGGIGLPTGQSLIDLGDGPDPGLQPGFGSPSFTVGASFCKPIGESFALYGDVSYDIFTTRRDQRFGNELRFDLAGVLEVGGDKDDFLRKADAVLELNYLQIARDIEGGLGQEATGGKILYLSPGMRFQLDDVNLGLLVKIPIAKNLNEAALQQGSEGTEQYRLIMTASYFFE